MHHLHHRLAVCSFNINSLATDQKNTPAAKGHVEAIYGLRLFPQLRLGTFVLRIAPAPQGLKLRLMFHEGEKVIKGLITGPVLTLRLGCSGPALVRRSDK